MNTRSWTSARSGGLGARLIERVLSRDKRTCRYCGSTKRLSVDHVHPRHAGGSDSLDNLVTACMRCNSAKGRRRLSASGLTLLSVQQARDIARARAAVRQLHLWPRVNLFWGALDVLSLHPSVTSRLSAPNPQIAVFVKIGGPSWSMAATMVPSERQQFSSWVQVDLDANPHPPPQVLSRWRLSARARGRGLGGLCSFRGFCVGFWGCYTDATSDYS